MQAYQQYIDDIQGAVYSPETADPDFLRDSAAMYAEACAEINDRLRNVGRLLHRGLRSEAIQLAEQEPNLLDMVAMLDFQELPAWREMLVEWGMAEPPRLLIDTAADLNKAYAEQQPLESLLKQHRILALGRAPLAVRISTLRRIRDADDRNETWTADLITFEKARLKQIAVEADVARRAGDVIKLTSLTEELRAPGWVVDRPKLLVDTVEQARARVAAIAARKELSRLDTDLNAAHMAFDVAKGRPLRQRWHEAAQIAGLSADDELAERAAPALEWLDDEDLKDSQRQRFAAAVASLQRVLDDDGPAREVGRLYEAATHFEEPLPDGLRRRAEQRLADYELHNRRRRRLILGSAAAVFLLLALAVGFLIVQQTQAKRASEAAASLAKMIDDGSYDNAQRYFEDLRATSPKLALASPMQEQKVRLDKLIAAEVNRDQRFTAAIEAAEQAPSDSSDRQALARAKALAKTEKEHSRVARVEAAVAAAMRQKQQEQDRALTTQLSELSEQLRSLAAETGDDLESRLTAFSQLRNRVEAAKQKFPAASGAILGQATPLILRIDALVESIRTDQNQLAARSRITESVGDFAAYVGALEAYEKSFPDTALATNVAAIKAEQGLWEGLLEWSDFHSANFRSKWPATAADVRATIKSGEELVAKHGMIPLGSYFTERKAYLTSMAAREPESGDAPLIELRRLFRDPLISKLWMVTDRVGPRYDLREKPEETEVSLRFKYLAGFDLSEKPGTVQKRNAIYNGPAPQSEVAAIASTALDEIPTRGWESVFVRILQAAGEPKKDIDPILRIVLLQRVLDTAVVGSTVLDQGFREYRNALGEANVDLSVPWMAPQDETATRERQRAKLILDGLPPMADAVSTAAQQLKKIKELPPAAFTWIGWLSEESGGRWAILPQPAPTMRGTLTTVSKPAGTESATLTVIGTVNEGIAQITGAPGDLLAGRPVFFQSSSD